MLELTGVAVEIPTTATGGGVGPVVVAVVVGLKCPQRILLITVLYLVMEVVAVNVGGGVILGSGFPADTLEAEAEEEE